jgi:hypothetical protein
MMLFGFQQSHLVLVRWHLLIWWELLLGNRALPALTVFMHALSLHWQPASQRKLKLACRESVADLRARCTGACGRIQEADVLQCIQVADNMFLLLLPLLLLTFICTRQILGKFVPKGSRLLLSTLMGQVLTDPKLNPNLGPQQLETLDSSWYSINAKTLHQDFKPERWLVQQQQQDGSSGSSNRPSQLLTFSVGPHVCLGLSLFMHEAKVLLALLARGYSLDVVNGDDVLFNCSVVTQLKSDTQVKFGRVQQPAEVPVAAR